MTRINHSPSRHLKRTVWLSQEDRDLIREAIQVASLKLDTFQYGVNFVQLTKELDKADSKHTWQKKYRSQLVTLIVSEMRLPKDWMPLTITSEEIEALTVWGNLPERVMIKTLVQPKIFYTEDHPFFYYDDLPDAQRILISEKKYDRLRKKYRIRLMFRT